MNQFDIKPLAYLLGYACDEQTRHRASSGGIGTALMRYLLSTPEFGTALSFEFSPEECRYKPRLAYSPDEIRVCGSIYQDIDIVGFLRENLDSIKGGIVLSCSPCHVLLARNLLQKQGVPCFIISYNCSGQTTIEGTWKYYDLVGIKKEDVQYMQYRGNGWPSGIQIWLRNGELKKFDNYAEPWSTLHRSNLYRPKRCFYCTLDTGRLADIALADPWLNRFKECDKIGTSLVLPFSQLGFSVLQTMQNQGIIVLSPSDYNDYATAQAPNIHKPQRLSEKRSLIRFQLWLMSLSLYYGWATRDLANIHRHIKITFFVSKLLPSAMGSRVFSRLFQAIARKYRYYRVKGKLGSCAGDVDIRSGVEFNNPRCIHLGKKVIVNSGVFFGPITSYAGVAYRPRIVIGDGCMVGKNNSFAAVEGVIIGKNVLFAGQVHITDHSHGYLDIEKPIRPQPLICKGPVVIDDDCWLGFGCEILSNVHIGKHSIVAARSVVTKDVPPFSIVAGNPARIVKRFNQNTRQWERVSSK